MRQELLEGLAAGTAVAAVLLWLALRTNGLRDQREPLPVAGHGIAFATLAAIALHATSRSRFWSASPAWHWRSRASNDVVGVGSKRAAGGALLRCTRRRCIRRAMGHRPGRRRWTAGGARSADRSPWHREAITPALFLVSARSACSRASQIRRKLPCCSGLRCRSQRWAGRFASSRWSLGRCYRDRCACLGGAVGGRGRPASIIGALACVGLLAGLSAGAMLAGKAAPALRRWSGAARSAAVVIAQIPVVALASRWAGLQTDPVEAGAVASLSVVLSVLAGGLIAPPKIARSRAPISSTHRQ